MSAEIVLSKAKIWEAKQIQEIVNFYAEQGQMLPLSLNEIYDQLRDFWVAKREGKMVGVSALHFCWEDLAEIRSLAVKPAEQRKGIGRQLVKKCLAEAKRTGIKKVFVLTYLPSFFEKLKFRKISKSSLPHKVWRDCLNCPHFPNCEESALIYEWR